MHTYIHTEIQLYKYQFGETQHGRTENEQGKAKLYQISVGQTSQGVTGSRLTREGILSWGEAGQGESSMMGKSLGTLRNKLRLGGRVLPGGHGTGRSASGKHW